MWIIGGERRVIGISLTYDFADSDNRWGIGARVIEKDLITHFHAVAHERPRCVVPDAIPERRLVRAREKVVERKRGGLRFHEPKPLFTRLSGSEDPGPCTLFLRRRRRFLGRLPLPGHVLRARLMDGFALAHVERLGGAGA